MGVGVWGMGVNLYICTYIYITDTQTEWEQWHEEVGQRKWDHTLPAARAKRSATTAVGKSNETNKNNKKPKLGPGESNDGGSEMGESSSGNEPSTGTGNSEVLASTGVGVRESASGSGDVAGKQTACGEGGSESNIIAEISASNGSNSEAGLQSESNESGSAI